MDKLTSEEFVKKLAKVFPIDVDRATSVTIFASPHDVVRISIDYIATKSDADVILCLIADANEENKDG